MRRSESSVSDRLRAALTLEPVPGSEGVDMSARAVTDRLLECCEMSSTCLELQARFAAALGRKT